MRLAVYIRSVRTARGAEQVSANVARGLAELGYQVDFLVEDDQGWLLDKLRRHANISVIDLRDAARNRLMHRWYQWQVLLRSLLLVAAGKFKPQKDFATLLKAFVRLRGKRPLRLLILGEGAERSALEQLVNQLGIAADVDMPGYVENPYPYFRQAAVFVLSSAWEGLPNVLIEAMACGCPVVATDCPSGPGEILDQGRIGRLVPVGDVTAMAGAIDATLDAPAPKELFVERAKHYSYDGVVADYARVLTGSSARLVAD